MSSSTSLRLLRVKVIFVALKIRPVKPLINLKKKKENPRTNNSNALINFEQIYQFIR